MAGPVFVKVLRYYWPELDSRNGRLPLECNIVEKKRGAIAVDPKEIARLHRVLQRPHLVLQL